MPSGNFCKDSHGVFLEKVWLKKKRIITLGRVKHYEIFTPIGSHVKGKKKIIKI